MASRIDAPTKCELRSVMSFLQAGGNSAAEIHRMSRVYIEIFMCGVICVSVECDEFGACRKFKDGRTDVHDEEGQGRKSVATKDPVSRQLLEPFKWDVSDQPANSPDLAI
ncbi:hypothetical protein AVEN_117260-1 [Araneus ventricosus]|uniref:Mos1 transposase HTH domain-containing protein n=1 Tax=Araneus ventricosus TaxID=182803 RepID=A0A4Y2B0A7_ARAVE|nr:hypothetical protein AVEN_117260-1 [Araneus ventricosus]